MFLIIDSSPAVSAEPCKACTTLIEVGPPPMMDGSDSSDVLVTPLMPCRHNRVPSGVPQELDLDLYRIENCA